MKAKWNRGSTVAGGAGPVGMHLSQQRERCFLSSHGLVLASSGNIAQSVYWNQGRIWPLLLPLGGKEHAAT